MLKIRNYQIDDENEFVNSKDEEFLIHKKNDETDKIYVFFPKANSKIGVHTIRQYVKEMQESEVKQSIVVVKDSITSFAKQVFTEIKPLVIECFKENELIVDKLSHVLVPKHEILSEEEKKELLKIYKIKEIHLPKILSSDPVSRYFGAKKGQVFKINRHSETCGDYIYYRVVV
jgi:DNA-directed RNA polymerase I, II, and III subunit RPABC1